MLLPLAVILLAYAYRSFQIYRRSVTDQVSPVAATVASASVWKWYKADFTVHRLLPFMQA